MKIPVSNTGTNDAAEQRTSKRKSVIDEQIATADLGDYTGALVLDVSEGGMSLHAVSGPREGETTSVTFELPGTNQRLTAEGTVQWAEESGRMGLKFHQLDPKVRAQLRRWIEAEQVLEARHDAQGDAALEALLAQDFWEAPDTAEKPLPLALIVEQITWSTRASGAAIALDGPGGMVCRASFGNAPAVGVPVKGSTGLSGECLRTSAPVRCVDTEVDPRVDRLACRQVKVRSITIVPVTREGRAIGLLEVFSPDAHAFGNNEVAMLTRAAATIAAIGTFDGADQPEPTAKPPQPVVGPSLVKAMMAAAKAPLTSVEQAPVVHPAVAAAVKPLEVLTTERTPAEIVLEQTSEVPVSKPPATPVAVPTAKGEPVVELKATPPAKPDVEIPIAVIPDPIPVLRVPAALTPEPKQQQTKKEEQLAPAIEPVVAIPATSGCAAAAKMAKVVEAPAQIEEPTRVAASTVVAATPIVATSDFATLDTVAARSGSRLSRVAIAAVVVLAVAAVTFGAWKFSERSNAVTASTAAPKATATSAPPPAPATTAPAPTTAAPANTNKPVAVPSAAHTAPEAAKQPVATGRTVTIPVAEPPKLPVQQPMTVAANPPSQPAPPVQVAAPPAIPMASNASAIRGILGAPEAAPKLGAVRVSEGVSGGKLLQRVQPVYPAAARAGRLTGAVTLTIRIDTKGNVSKVQVQSGPPILADAAVQAVRRWKYEPFQLNGEPIENDTQVTFRFDLPK